MTTKPSELSPSQPATALPAQPVGSALLERVRAALRVCIAAGNPGIHRVAEQLALSPRSLQRYLRRHGTSHRALLQAFRSEIVAAAPPNRPARELAKALGYISTRSVTRRLGRAESPRNPRLPRPRAEHCLNDGA